MKYHIRRPLSTLNASIVLPASKSISNRLLLIHALSGTDSVIENLSESDDTHYMLDALKSSEELKDVGPAGTSMRFLTAYYSCIPGSVIMTGSERMKQRPIGPLVETLKTLGASIEYLEKDGYPPMRISGKTITGGRAEIEGSVSSQFISALLMIAPTFENGLELVLQGGIVSRSYIQMTLDLMEEFGVNSDFTDNVIKIKPGNYRKGSYMVESDWSAASYWYALCFASKGSIIRLPFLKDDSLQGDSILTGLFARLGVQTEFTNEEAVIRNSDVKISSRIVFDFTNCPDIVQTMAVILCMKNIPFRFTGTKTLRVKETDRIDALQVELKKYGYILLSDSEGSFLSWEGERCEEAISSTISTYHDHRMAMAFAPLAMFREQVIIDDPGVVSKSYPNFWEDLKSAGFSVEELK